MTMADRIQHLRKSRGMSQEELADKMGVSRQAVSKWESEQSSPDIEKLIMLSDYFNVTTDYLLKGTEPLAAAAVEKTDARIFSAIGTALNFVGLIVAMMIWKEEQTSLSVAVGAILMAVGCIVFVIGQFIGENRKKALFSFWSISIWFLSLMPISCIFNSVQGIIGGHWWTFRPTPELGNSIGAYVMCWGIYFVACIIFDIALFKRARRSIPS